MEFEYIENNLASEKRTKKFVILTIAQAIFQFFSFYRWYLLVNYLDIEDFGIYSLVARYILILMPIVSLGLGNALLVYIPKLFIKKKKSIWVFELKIFFLLVISISSFFFISSLIYISGLISSTYFNEFFYIIVIHIITLVMNNFMYLYFIAHSKITFAAIFSTLQSFISIIFISYFISYSLNLVDILWGINYSQIIVVGIGLLKIIQVFICNKKGGKINTESLEKYFILKIFIKFNLFWIIFNLCYIFFKNIEPIIIYELLGLEISSFYSYLLTLSSISSLGFIAINQYLISRFSMKNNISDIDSRKIEFTEEFESCFHFSFWIVLLISLFIHNIIIFFPTFIKFNKFQGNLSILYLLFFSEVIIGYSILNMALLSAKEEIAKNSIAILTACILLYLLNLILTPLFGLYGVISVKIIIGLILCSTTAYLLRDSLKIRQIIKNSNKLIFLLILSTLISFSELKFNIYTIFILDVSYFTFLFKDKMFCNFLKQILSKKSNIS